MEYEKDANFSNFTFDEEITPASSTAYIAHEIIFTIFTIIGILADIAIIYIIFRFQKMKRIENIFLANWAISDLGSLLVAPSGYRILSIMDNISISAEFMCTLFHVGQTFQATTMLFVLLICIDWFIRAYFEKTSQKFRTYQKFYIGAIWIFSILISSISTGYCIGRKYSMIPSYFFLAFFFTILLLVVVMQSSRAVRKYFLKKSIDYTSIFLNIATAFPLTYILGVLLLVILHQFVIWHPLIGMITEILIFSNSIVNLILLYNYNKDFQACFLQVLRKGKYEESQLSFDNPLVNKVYDKCSVPIRISFKDNADLINNEVY